MGSSRRSKSSTAWQVNKGKKVDRSVVDTTNQAPAGARRVVLLGQGISYSASPAMQSAAFAAAGLNWRYDELEGDAVAAGAVNTIRRDGERLLGSNTDVVGIRTALGSVGVEPLGSEVVVLGVGGTARAAAVALHGARLTFVARRPEAGAGLPGQVLGWDDPGWQARGRHADLIVKTTPLGRRGVMTIRPNFLPPRGAVIDLVYMAGGTPLVRRSRQLGLRCADGWGILVAQGAAAFQAWTGLPAPVDAMRAALDEG